VPRGKTDAPAPASPPLLLMFDGQNIFDDAPSFAGGWHLHAAVERRARSRRKAVAPVVLGLEHGGVLRMRELNPFAPDGRLDAQLDWIEGTLLPDVRARLGLALCEVWVGGSSMGALAALYAHLSRPHLFRGALAMSPALPVTRGAFFSVTQRGIRRPGQRHRSRGTGLATRLRRRGWRPTNWRHFVKAANTRRHWRWRLPRRFLFAGQRAAGGAPARTSRGGRSAPAVLDRSSAPAPPGREVKGFEMSPWRPPAGARRTPRSGSRT
jgi:hypothetical protein